MKTEPLELQIGSEQHYGNEAECFTEAVDVGSPSGETCFIMSSGAESGT